MRISFFTIIMFLLSVNIASCSAGNDFAGADTENQTENDSNLKIPQNIENMKLKITIGNRTLIASLDDNLTTRDFMALLPLTVRLDDYVNKEKVFYPDQKLSVLGASLDTDPAIGDITYYSPWHGIAIFYRNSVKANGLVRIGKIESGIEALQVAGSIENVTFELVQTND